MAIKEHRGGKYERYVDKAHFGRGYFGVNDAGIPREPGTGGDPIKREFIGSNLQEYTFSDPVHGTHTFVVSSYEEALRLAKLFGFTYKDYKRRHKR